MVCLWLSQLLRLSTSSWTADKLEAAVTPKTKAIILNNPSNPTGMMYSREELEAIGAVCLKHEI